MKCFNRVFSKFNFLFIVKSYFLLSILMFPVQGWCGRECLGLCDDEISNKKLARVFRHMNNFVVKHETTISGLTQDDKSLLIAISQGVQPAISFSSSAKQTLHAMRVQEVTFIGQDYADSPKKLQKHLKEIKKIAEVGPSDLDEKQSQILKGYANLLLFLSKF